MKVAITPTARAELDAIRRWIARDNRVRAISFTRELVGKAEGLATAHAHYPEVDPIGFSGVRRVNHRGYRIFYRVMADAIEVLHFHHPAQAAPDFPECPLPEAPTKL